MYFKRSSLQQAGYVLQLSHHPANICMNPQWSTKTFTVIHTNRIHLVDLTFCGCNEVGNHGTWVQQLLHRHLFPTTMTNPQTACTFLLLKLAQLLSLQLKLSLYDYYLCIEWLTGATSTTNINVGSPWNYFLINWFNVFKGPV